MTMTTISTTIVERIPLEFSGANSIGCARESRLSWQVAALLTVSHPDSRGDPDLATVRIEVTDGSAEALPAGDGEFDAAVTSLVLCSVPDQDAALREIFRVLRSGGELCFYEHVVALRLGTARAQRLLDATIYPFLAGGCHCARDTGAAIERAGFEIEREERIAFRPSPLVPAIPHILGTARRP
jgi:SAM-dependent methyltransferase